MADQESQKNGGVEPPRRLTKKPKEIAQELGLNVETVYDYIKDGLFTNSEYMTIQRGERVRYVFFADAALKFLNRTSGLTPEERPKRAYNKRVTKGKHQKKGEKSA